MHPQTRAIAEFETKEDAKAAGFNIQLSAQEAADLRDIRREDRMRALKTWRRRNKKAQAKRKAANKRAKASRRANR